MSQVFELPFTLPKHYFSRLLTRHKSQTIIQLGLFLRLDVLNFACQIVKLCDYLIVFVVDVGGVSLDVEKFEHTVPSTDYELIRVYLDQRSWHETAFLNHQCGKVRVLFVPSESLEKVHDKSAFFWNRSKRIFLVIGKSHPNQIFYCPFVVTEVSVGSGKILVFWKKHKIEIYHYNRSVRTSTQ